MTLSVGASINTTRHNTPFFQRTSRDVSGFVVDEILEESLRAGVRETRPPESRNVHVVLS